jgi:signal transduction histidine kinase
MYRLPAQQVALETIASIVALLAGFLVFGRLQRNSCLDELVLAAALAVITLSNMFFVLVPMLVGRAPANPVMWSAITGRAAGCLLFAGAAFVPVVRLRQPRQAQWLAAAGVLGILVLTAVVPHLAAGSLPRAVTHHLHAVPMLVAAQLAAAGLTAPAAAGYLRRSERLGDEFSGWLAIAAVFAAASDVSYSLKPAIYASQVTPGDLFRFCFYIVLLTCSLREIRSYWRTLASAIVAEERRRIARDLHDGLSQELAYLTRHLSALRGVADERTLSHLQVSVERARHISRQAVGRVTAPVCPSIADALTEAAGEVAERLDLDLDLDLDRAAGIGLAPAQADALVRIACEALTNVARHSGSRQVSLIVWPDGDRVRMRVRDPGRGFDLAASRRGFGLTSMRDRARSVGGELRISSAPGAGSMVEATL